MPEYPLPRKKSGDRQGQGIRLEVMCLLMGGFQAELYPSSSWHRMESLGRKSRKNQIQAKPEGEGQGHGISGTGRAQTEP